MVILTLSAPPVNLLSLSIFQPPPEAIRPLPDVPAGRTFRPGDAQFDHVGAPRPWPYRRDPVPWLLPSLLKGSFQSQRPLEADALSFWTNPEAGLASAVSRSEGHGASPYGSLRGVESRPSTARCTPISLQEKPAVPERGKTLEDFISSPYTTVRAPGRASSVWRRRAGSNRCIAVLQCVRRCCDQ